MLVGSLPTGMVVWTLFVLPSRTVTALLFGLTIQILSVPESTAMEKGPGATGTVAITWTLPPLSTETVPSEPLLTYTDWVVGFTAT